MKTKQNETTRTYPNSSKKVLWKSSGLDQQREQHSQQTLTCIKSTTETLEKSVKYVES